MKRSAIAIAGLGALAVGLIAYLQLRPQDDTAEPQQSNVRQAEMQPAPTPEPLPEPDAEVAVSSAPASEETANAAPAPEDAPAEGAAPKPETDPVEPAQAPKFDVVRVDPQGQAVVAGQAAPGAVVEILVDGEVVATETADASGSFVSLFKIASTGAARQLVLRAAGAESGETVVAASGQPIGQTETGASAPELTAASQPATGDAPAIAAATPAPGGEPELALAPPTADGDRPSLAQPRALTPGEAASDLPSPDTVSGQISTDLGEIGGDGVAGASDTVILLPGAQQGDAPLLIQPGAEELALLQPADRPVQGVRLDRISYTEGGDLDFLGRGVPGNTIRVYVNAGLAEQVSVIPAGQWRAVIAVDRARDAKLLRFDEVDASGTVVSRIETPFSYEAGSGPKTLQEREVEIARGDYLWRIAERYYGEGIRYSLIFSANSDLIRDPDLIYPGQVFTVPELVDSQ